MTHLYLVRHGETVYNKKGIYYGWTDCSLSSIGVEQSEELAEELRDIVFDVIVSSPLKRAMDTAKIIAGSSAPAIVSDRRLMELNFGDWEGKHYQDIEENYPREWERWQNDWKQTAPPAGECYQDLFCRVKSSLQDILSKYQGKTVLIVSHNGCLRIIMSHLLGMGEDGYWHFKFEQGKYSLLEISDGFCTVHRVNA